jgi:hypothetical protein
MSHIRVEIEVCVLLYTGNYTSSCRLLSCGLLCYVVWQIVTSVSGAFRLEEPCSVVYFSFIHIEVIYAR